MELEHIPDAGTSFKTVSSAVLGNTVAKCYGILVGADGGELVRTTPLNRGTGIGDDRGGGQHFPNVCEHGRPASC